VEQFGTKSFLFGLISLCCVACFANEAPMMEPTNLSIIKTQMRHYHDSGSYYKQISNATREALYYLRFRITNNERLKHPKKLAVVLDIDETAISNYPDIDHLNFGGTMAQILALETQAHDDAIPYTRTLYQYAKGHDVAVFFISGRHENMRTPTETNLKHAGYDHWDGLYLEPNNYHKPTAVPFKTAMRRQISEKGFDIILDVGDQMSDLKGGYADMEIKLPNPFYYVS